MFLEGSVRTGGDKIRITAQLIDALTGNHLWAEQYDRNLDDIFAVQDEITKEDHHGYAGKADGGRASPSELQEAQIILKAYLKCLQANELYSSG